MVLSLRVEPSTMNDELDEAELERLEVERKKANKLFEDSKGRFDRLEGLMEAILQKLDKLDQKMGSSGTGSGFKVGSSSYAISTVHNRQSGFPFVQPVNFSQPLTKTMPMDFPGFDSDASPNSVSTLATKDEVHPGAAAIGDEAGDPLKVEADGPGLVLDETEQGSNPSPPTIDKKLLIDPRDYYLYVIAEIYRLLPLQSVYCIGTICSHLDSGLEEYRRYGGLKLVEAIYPIIQNKGCCSREIPAATNVDLAMAASWRALVKNEDKHWATTSGSVCVRYLRAMVAKVMERKFELAKLEGIDWGINMFSPLISVFDPGISVRVSCLVEAGVYYHFSCGSSCLANIPSSMKFINECSATLIGALTRDTIFQSHARFLSKLITWFHATFIEPCTYFISDVLEWGLKMHKDFVDYGRLYVGALIISTVMLLFTGMADLFIISGLFLVHFKQQDLLIYSAWAYEIVGNAGSIGYVEIITAAAILIVVFALCFLVMFYKLMSLCFAEVPVVLFYIGGIEGLQTYLVVLLSCFRWFQPDGQTFVKVPFLGVVSYFPLSVCIGYINWTTPHISKHYGIAIGNWCLVGVNLHLLFLCSVVVPEPTFRLLISVVVPSACLVNSTWNSLDSPYMASLFGVIVQGWYFRIIYASSMLASLFFPYFDLEDKVNFPGGGNVMNQMGLDLG